MSSEPEAVSPPMYRSRASRSFASSDLRSGLRVVEIIRSIIACSCVSRNTSLERGVSRLMYGLRCVSLRVSVFCCVRL